MISSEVYEAVPLIAVPVLDLVPDNQMRISIRLVFRSSGPKVYSGLS
jgi:hypothetical protein